MSNIVEFKRGPAQRDISIVIKANNCSVKSCCSVCGICDREQTPFDVYLDEPGHNWVCGNCLDKHEFKGYAQCLDILNSAAYLVLHEKSESAKETLEQVKVVLGQAVDVAVFGFKGFNDAPDGDGEGIPF